MVLFNDISQVNQQPPSANWIIHKNWYKSNVTCCTIYTTHRKENDCRMSETKTKKNLRSRKSSMTQDGLMPHIFLIPFYVILQPNLLTGDNNQYFYNCLKCVIKKGCHFTRQTYHTVRYADRRCTIHRHFEESTAHNQN